MPKSKIKKIIDYLFSDLTLIKGFLDKAHIKIIYFIPSTALSFIASLFDAFSIALLIPLAKGIINQNFAFVRKLPGFDIIINKFPQLFTTPNSSIFLLIISIIVLATITKHVLLYLSTIIFLRYMMKFKSSMRKFVFNRYMDVGKLFFDRTIFGHRMAVMSFAEGIGEFLDTIKTTINSFFFLLVYLTMMVFISWRLTLGLLVVFPVMNYATRWIRKRVKETAQYSKEASKAYYANLFNIFPCIPLVKVNATEDSEKKRFRWLSDKLAEWTISMRKKTLIIPPAQELIMLFMAIGILVFAMFFIFKDKTQDVSTLLIYFYIFRRCTNHFPIFNRIAVALAQQKPKLEELVKLFDDKDKFFVLGGSKKFSGIKKEITIKNLNFSYIKGLEILKNINLTLKKGEATAIVGPTGSGKTTLASLLLRLYDCSPKSIFIDGKDIRNFSIPSLMKHMAYVAQDTQLFNGPIRANIKYGIKREVKDEEILKAAKKARLHDFIIEQLPHGLDTLIGDRGVRLSGGERQRVSIARALLKGSEILILDEATSSLDSVTEKLIQESIDEAVRDKTAIVIAHRLSTIKEADKIVVIEDGRLVEQGTLDELLKKKGKFYIYWQQQKFD